MKKQNIRFKTAVILIVFAIASFFRNAIAADPMNTVREEMNRAPGGSGGSPWQLLSLILFPIAIWLVASSNSPMSGWAHKNQGLAYLFIIAFPCMPLLLVLI